MRKYDDILMVCNRLTIENTDKLSIWYFDLTLRQFQCKVKNVKKCTKYEFRVMCMMCWRYEIISRVYYDQKCHKCKLTSLLLTLRKKYNTLSSYLLVYVLNHHAFISYPIYWAYTLHVLLLESLELKSPPLDYIFFCFR